MAMLNRWVQMKRDINQNKGKINEKLLKKPDDPKEAKNVTEAEVWKASLVKQIIKKVSEIQNGSLGEYRIRELNDSINEMLVEKAKWEERIRELGGRNYNEEDG
jgi:pre-mRNA-splicing factor ISY1